MCEGDPCFWLLCQQSIQRSCKQLFIGTGSRGGGLNRIPSDRDKASIWNPIILELLDCLALPHKDSPKINVGSSTMRSDLTVPIYLFRRYFVWRVLYKLEAGLQLSQRCYVVLYEHTTHTTHLPLLCAAVVRFTGGFFFSHTSNLFSLLED
jgi:hypothetical protein